jgi:hypothetical protein
MSLMRELFGKPARCLPRFAGGARGLESRIGHDFVVIAGRGFDLGETKFLKREGGSALIKSW